MASVALTWRPWPVKFASWGNSLCCKRCCSVACLYVSLQAAMLAIRDAAAAATRPRSVGFGSAKLSVRSSYSVAVL